MVLTLLPVWDFLQMLNSSVGLLPRLASVVEGYSSIRFKVGLHVLLIVQLHIELVYFTPALKLLVYLR